MTGERAITLRVTEWGFDTIIQSLDTTINRADDLQFEKDVRALVIELAGQLNDPEGT